MVKKKGSSSVKKIKDLLNPLNYFANPRQKYLRYGNRLFEQEQYEDAISAFKAAIRDDPKCLQAYLGIGNAHLEMGGIQNSKTAIKYYQRALFIDFSQIHIYNKIIKVYDRLGDNRNIMVEKKKLFIAKTLKNDPENALANNNMGVIQLKQKNYSAAIKFFNNAVKHDKYLDVAKLNLSKALYKRGTSLNNPEKAKDFLMRGITELEKLLQKIEDSPELLLLKAKFLFKLGEEKSSLAICEQVIKLDSTMKEAFATKSVIETKLGNIMDASSTYDSFQSLKKAEMLTAKQKKLE